MSNEKLREAAQGIIDRKSSTFKARNGRAVGIEADDGEKCYIVHSDDIHALEAALASIPVAAADQPGDGAGDVVEQPMTEREVLERWPGYDEQSWSERFHELNRRYGALVVASAFSTIPSFTPAPVATGEGMVRRLLDDLEALEPHLLEQVRHSEPGLKMRAMLSSAPAQSPVSEGAEIERARERLERSTWDIRAYPPSQADIRLVLDSRATPSRSVSLDAYDAGLLGDGGGGDVDWWQDYLRAELGRAHDFYSDQVAALTNGGDNA